MAKSRTEQMRELDRLLSKQERRIRLAFDDYVVGLLQDDVLSQIVDALAVNDVERALEIMRPHLLQLSNVLPVVYTDAGVDMAKEITQLLPFMAASIAVPVSIPTTVTTPTGAPIDTPVVPPDQARQPTVSVGFDPSHPRAVEQMRTNKLNFVQQVTDQQRDMIRNVMQQSFDQGFGPRKVSSLLKESIGLTANQQQAVQNYRALLENRDSRALRRDIRDRRFDRTVERAIREDKPLSTAQIDKMVERYHQRYIQYRGEVIARTESVRATSQARMEAIRQMIDETGLDPASIKRTWNRTNDHRTRDWHRSMQDQKRGMDEAFEDGKGQKLMYPGDPAAPGNTTINCRCVLTISQS